MRLFLDILLGFGSRCRCFRGSETSKSAILCFSLAKTGSNNGCSDFAAMILRLSGISFRLKSLQAHAVIEDIKLIDCGPCSADSITLSLETPMTCA